MEKSLFNHSISHKVEPDKYVSLELGYNLFHYFKESTLFRWSDANNDCEDRANAICMLLDSWNIPNYKGWVFSGYFLKRDLGSLSNFWNYHVAALLPVKLNEVMHFYIIDPATQSSIIPLREWAENITGYPYSYHAVTTGDAYIFSYKNIKNSNRYKRNKKTRNNNWYKRNKSNYGWTMEGLSGINGLSATGKAYLRFNRSRITKTEEVFKNLIGHKPHFNS